MIALKMLLTVAGVLLMAAALGIPVFGIWKRVAMARKKAETDGVEIKNEETVEIFWRGPLALGIVACLPLLIAASIVVVPSGMGGVRISQVGGTLPGTLYPGVHFITPLVDQRGDLRPARPHVYGGMCRRKERSRRMRMTALDVQSREGLNIGLGVTVRYRLDPNKLATVQAHLPQPADKELVPPVVASAWRELAPQYTVREIFSSKREEVRAKAASDHHAEAGRRRNCGGRGDAVGDSAAG